MQKNKKIGDWGLGFDSTKPHGMLAIGNQPVKFLAFTVE